MSFFLGTCLTATDAGFLDGTPIRRGKLVDFVPCGDSLKRAVELAEDFWRKKIGEPRNAQRFAVAVHALFLGQFRRALQFEEFIYLYAALDACYALTKVFAGLKGPRTHAQRIKWTCDQLGVGTPVWAKSTSRHDTVVSGLRNNALHEALFVDEPLGFAVCRDDRRHRVPLLRARLHHRGDGAAARVDRRSRAAYPPRPVEGFCRRIAWRKPDGGLKDMMARVTLLAMHRDRLIELPPPRCQ